MRISTLLDHIDSGHMALPEFQRGYVWNRDQVRGLFDSLYRRHPVGGLLVWATDSQTAEHRGDGKLATGTIKLLLDGQQRVTSLYGVIRGKAPEFFDGNAATFTGLRFHLDNEIFAFYQPIKMQDDALWIDVTELMQKGTGGLGAFIARLSANPATIAKVGDYAGRLSQLLGIADIDLHIEEITGKDKTLDVVVDIFNRVNSGGTKLSKGDLALAKICADWPSARDEMKSHLAQWVRNDYDFSLDWLLRCLNTVLTGEAKFQFLHEQTAPEVQDGLKRAHKHIDACLNMIAGRLGLDHDRVVFGKFAIPVMVRFLDGSAALSAAERDKLLFWFVQAGMWGRFSGSVESFIDQDLALLEGPNGGLDRLLEQMRLWHGGLTVEPNHFDGWSLGARFYPILYMITRTGGAVDWGNGLELKAQLLGKMNSLEVHHIFPKAQLYKRNWSRDQVNALANFCFLTKDTNLKISDRLPQDYFPKIEKQHPGALASQWIPMDEELWKIENYAEFLDARKELLAQETNRLMRTLLHGETHWLDGNSALAPTMPISAPPTAANEDAEVENLNQWIADLNLPRGEIDFELSDTATGAPIAVFDLAWPKGIQEELSQPVALLQGQNRDVLALANSADYRYFTGADELKNYVETEILASKLTTGTP